MTDIFIQIINMSINAAWLVLAVVIFRLIFKKAPKYISVCLWALVGLRLLLPISFETTLSLIPSAQTVPSDIVYSGTPMINSGVSMLNSSVNPIINEYFAPTPYNSANPLQIVIAIAGNVWVIGIAIMLIYAFISYLRVYKTVREAIILRDNIYLSDKIQVPFILGIIKPKIYLPLGISEEDTEFVLAHEQAHIKRKDHLWKPLGFLLLSVYWFNPIIWVAYILLCRDIEAACDQKVINGADIKDKKAYSEALINLSAPRKFITACPLAFGETGIKSRLKAILNYKKPAFWVSVAAIVLTVVLAVCFLTNPVKKRIVDINDPVAYITLLDNVTEYEFTILPYYSQNFHAEEEIKDITQKLLEIEISHSPISQSRDENRPSDYRIIVCNGGYGIINFNEDFTQVWINDLVKPSFSYKVLNPQVVAELFNKYTDNPNPYKPSRPAVTNGEKLTLKDVIELSKKGNELGWADFENFSYFETGSGLYIRQYEIDEMFYLSVGGTNTDEEVWYIYLTANDGLESSIDIRESNVEDYINQHKNNPVVKDILWKSWSISPVGFSNEIYNKIIEKWGTPKYAYLSSVKTYPTVRIKSKADFERFMDDFEGLMNFDRNYADDGYVSFNSRKNQFGNRFFEYMDLILVYLPSGDYTTRYNITGLSKSQKELRILINETETGNMAGNKEGWLFAIRVARDEIEDVTTINACDYIPKENTQVKTAIKTYSFRESEDVIKPTLTLFEGNEFSFTFSGISSYLGFGTYHISDNSLTLRTSDGRYRYVFEIRGEELIFKAGDSSKELHYSGLYDGAVMK